MLPKQPIKAQNADGTQSTDVTTILVPDDSISGGIVDLSVGGGGASIGETITGATAGSVFFAGAAGVLAQDNTNFYWDDATNQLRLKAGAATDTPVIVKAAAAQSAYLQEWQKSDGTVGLFVAADPVTYGLGVGQPVWGSGIRGDSGAIVLSSSYNEVFRAVYYGNWWHQSAYCQMVGTIGVPLVNSTAKKVADILVPTLSASSGVFHVRIIAKDATDVQCRTQIVRWEAVNKGGVYTTNIAVVSEGASCSTGTLTATWSIVTGTNAIEIKVTPVSSLTPTTFEITTMGDLIPGGTMASS